MAIGAIGAILFQQKNRDFLQWSRHWAVQLGCWGIIGLLAVNRFAIPLFGHNVVAATTVCIIVAQITKTRRVVNLDSRVAEFLGKISYGVYVLHPLVITGCAYLLRGFDGPSWVKIGLAYVSVVGSTILAAFVSYNWFERPFLMLKERFSVVGTRAARTEREHRRPFVLPSA
jgi:peptidoglycan/LPS O-acetylase OafA/YrhL